MNNNPDFDPYEVLGIPLDASENDIKKAYKLAALEHHPDRLNNADQVTLKKSEDKMALINEAYALLRDPERKRSYDHMRRFGAFGFGNRASSRNEYRNSSTSMRQNTNTNHRPSRRPHSSRFSDPGPAPFIIPKQNEGRANFNMPYGIDPFLYIPKPKHTSDLDGSTSTGGFSFSTSTSTRNMDASGKMIFHRNVINSKNGWKEFNTETVTVETTGAAIYEKIFKKEPAISPLQGLKNAVFGGLSSLTNMCAGEGGSIR